MEKPVIGTPNGPCRECQSRYPSCHSHCQEYIEWKKKIEAIHKAQRDDSMSRDLISERGKRQIWRKSRYSRKRN